MAVTFDTILKNLHSKKFDPVYFLCGEESYFLDIVEDYIADNALEPHEKDFNFSVFYGKDADAVLVVNEAKQYPTFAEKRVVIVREAQDFKAKDWELFEKYLEHPVPSTILVFTHKNKTLDKRTKIAKTIEKQTTYFESKKINDDHLPGWISKYATEKKFKIKNEAAQVLADNLGNDLSRISNEINKLSVLLNENAEVTLDIIEKYIGISKDYNVTEFNKAIVTKDFSKAMKMVMYFEKNPKAGPLIQILAFLYNHFSKLFVIQQSGNLRQASEAMGFKNGWLPDDLKLGTKFYSLEKTKEILSMLCEYDAKSKGLYATNNNTNAELMKELVVKIIR